MFLFEKGNDFLKSLILTDDQSNDVSVDFKKKKITSNLSNQQIVKSMAELFTETANIEIDFNDPNFYSFDNIAINGEQHAIGIIYYYDNKTNPKYAAHQWIIDYNTITSCYTVGDVTSWQNTGWLSIYKYIIDFISNCNKNIYFGTFYIPYPGNAEDCINYIKNNKALEFSTLAGTVKFFNQTGLNGHWYNKLPENNKFTKGISLSDEFKISQSFINNFGGILNKSKDDKIVTTNLYTSMFDSFQNFSILAKLLILNGITVIDEYNTIYNKDNYQDLLNIDNIQQNENEFNAEKIVKDAELNQIEQKSKEIIKQRIGEKACENFEILNNNSISEYKLGTLDLVFETRGKDIFRKFDTPVLLEFFKDNNVSVEQLLEESSKRADKLAMKILDEFKKWIALFDEDTIKSLHKINAYYYQTYRNYLDSFLIVNRDKQWLKDIINEMRKEYINFVHKPEDIEYDSNMTDDEILNEIKYWVIVKGYYTHDNTDLYRYNDILLVRRFLCLMIKYCYEYDIHEISNGIDDDDFDSALNNWKNIGISKKKYTDNKVEKYIMLNDDDIITNNDYFVATSQYASNHGTSTKECVFKLSTYTRLYAFYYCIGKALTNAFNFKVFNPYHNEFNVKTELNDNKEPDMQAINFNAIDKMLQTIFSNKVKKAVKKSKAKIF